MVTKSPVELWVVGVEPAPQGSKRYVGNGRFIEASKKLEPFRQAVGKAVIAHMEKTGDHTQFTNPVEVTATFVLPRPKTVKRAWPSVAPDLDKLLRSCGDSLSLEKYCDGNPLIKDDALIVTWHAQKVYGTPEEIGVYVVIKEIEIPWHME